MAFNEKGGRQTMTLCQITSNLPKQFLEDYTQTIKLARKLQYSYLDDSIVNGYVDSYRKIVKGLKYDCVYVELYQHGRYVQRIRVLGWQEVDIQ